MATMSNIPEELSSLITCYLKPKDVFQLIDDVEKDYQILSDIEKYIKEKKTAINLRLMNHEKNSADEYAILNIKHTGESLYKIKRTDFIKIKEGAKFACEDDEMFIDETAINVAEFVSFEQETFTETDSVEWFPQSMRDKLFQHFADLAPEN
jgi:hypothetical protein